MNRVFAQANGDVAGIEKLLGFDEGHFAAGGGLVRVNVDNPLLFNARLPTGLERGANKHFRWGGHTDGGASEIVIDPFKTSTGSSFEFFSN